MSLPGGTLSSTPVVSDLLYPDGLERTDLREDFEFGGAALNDPTLGLLVKVWRAWTDGESIFVAPLSALDAPAVVLTGAGITEVSLAFDQNMRATVAFVEGGIAKLRWYDTVAAAMTTTSYAGARSPMVCMDDKREVQLALGGNDVILAYIRNSEAYYRVQRERFATEHLLGTDVSSLARITAMGMGRNNRLQVRIADFYRSLHPSLVTDTLFALDGVNIVPLLHGDSQRGLWRSRVYVFDEQPSFAWGLVEAGYPATLRLYGDGNLVYVTPPITSNSAFRLPPGKYREWQIEVESAANVSEVTLAGSREDLEV